MRRTAGVWLSVVIAALLGAAGCDDDPEPDADADADVDADSDADADADGEPDADADGEPDGDADGEPDGDADGEPDGDADGDAGDCTDGCLIAAVCHEEGDENPENVCQICDPDQADDAWSDNDGAACDDELFCNGADTCGAGTCSVHSDDACGDTERCDEDGDQCCTIEDHRACGAAGDVVWVDSCGVEGEVIEECADSPNAACRDGVCGCADGWTGDACDRCLIYVDDMGDDDAAGTSWATAKATVGAALAAAEAEGCEIWVAAGTYVPTTGTDRTATFQLVAGVDLYGGFAGTEFLRSERDIAANATILSGDIGMSGDITDNVYHVVTGADDAVLDGFTITGGNANVEPNGGGMVNVGVSPRVANCTFRENTAIWGGAMYNSGASPVITDCAFSGNSSSAPGGTIVATDASALVITGCRFEDNSSMAPGGVIYSNGSTLTVIDSRFHANGATSPGGVIQSEGESTILLVGTQFSGNTAMGPGGAVNVVTGTLQAVNCQFLDNSTTSIGGAVALSNATASLTNCAFSGNSANGSPGGAMSNTSSELTLLQCTISGNSTTVVGGGLYNQSSSPTIENSILWGNTAPTGTTSEQQIYNNDAESVPTVASSDVQGGYEGDGNIDADPLFAAGGLELSDGSPCIDAGNSALLPLDLADLDSDGDTAETLPLDLARNARVVGTAVDMGAYEHP